MLFVCVLTSNVLSLTASTAKTISFFGYDDCILLQNDSTKVILCPAAGGRVLEYSLNGKNALYLDQSEKGFIYEPGKRSGMSAGRFDIGPEKIIPFRPQLWMGRWSGEITGTRTCSTNEREGRWHRSSIDSRIHFGSSGLWIELCPNDQEYLWSDHRMVPLESHFCVGERHLCSSTFTDV